MDIHTNSCRALPSVTVTPFLKELLQAPVGRPVGAVELRLLVSYETYYSDGLNARSEGALHQKEDHRL